MKTISEIALLVLEKIKTMLGKKVNYNFDSIITSPPSHGLWDILLKKHITKEGMVVYKGFIKDKNKLIEYTTLLSNNPPSENWIKSEQLAYWINAYNAFTVLLIVENYPIKSIKDIAGTIPMINSVWDLKFFKIGTSKFDLNTIEHEILRKRFDEPRIHFAINCASISCPRLRSEAYVSNRINEQLEAQAVSFITDTDYNKIASTEVHLSKIFEWFKTDFIEGKNILQFLNKYLPVSLGDKVAIKYLPYNWNLNDAENQEVRP